MVTHSFNGDTRSFHRNAAGVARLCSWEIWPDIRRRELTGRDAPRRRGLFGTDHIASKIENRVFASRSRSGVTPAEPQSGAAIQWRAVQARPEFRCLSAPFTDQRDTYRILLCPKQRATWHGVESFQGVPAGVVRGVPPATRPAFTCSTTDGDNELPSARYPSPDFLPERASIPAAR